jgi:hypothetical protein
MADIEIVVTSLKIPAIDRGMIPALWMILHVSQGVPPSRWMTNKYSLATIENARLPGKMMASTVNSPLPSSKNPEWNTLLHPSNAKLTTPRTKAIKGANQKMVAKGLDNPIDFLCITVSVNAHRRPDRAEAENTMIIPGISTVVVSNNIRKTPKEIRQMTAIRRRE